jgi:hypothetical protein
MSESGKNIRIEQNNSTIGIGYSENVNTEQIAGTINNYALKPGETLTEAATKIQKFLNQLEQKEQYTPEEAQRKVANDLVIAANNNPAIKTRLVKWSKEIGDAAANGLIAETAVWVFKLSMQALGIPIP